MFFSISPFIGMFHKKGNIADGERCSCSTKASANSLELDHLSLSLLITTQLEMLATSQRRLFAVLAFGTLHTQHDFLGGLGLKWKVKWWVTLVSGSLFINSYLLSEDGFGLSSETLLFSVVTTTTLWSLTFLRLLVLWHLMNAMGVAFSAVRATLFWNVDLKLKKRF